MSTFNIVRFLWLGCAAFLVSMTVAFGLSLSTGPAGSNAQAVQAAGYDGLGINVGLISLDNARVSHEAFFDKNLLGEPVGSSHAHAFDATTEGLYITSSHDTAVAGIVCSRGGELYPLDQGVAPRAELYSFKIKGPLSETDPNRGVYISWIQNALDMAVSHGCDIIVAPVQFSGTADGTGILSKMFDYYAYKYGIFFATAAGNDASQITVFGDTYNSVTTGGLRLNHTTGIYDQIGTVSNPGPTTGSKPRRKPEVAGPSEDQWVPINGDTVWSEYGSSGGQTSYAAPHTAGVAALLLDYADESDDSNREHSEVIKAVMVNSTFPNIFAKDGSDTVEDLEFEPDWPWHFDRGYGRLDAWRAYQTLASPKITYGVDINQAAGWTYRSFGSSGVDDYYRVYGTRNSRLIVTMTWNRLINKIGSNYSADPLPLNLNMEIYDPQDVLAYSDRTTPDNLRKADILLESDGYYKIHIKNTVRKSNRAYALAFEVLEPLAGDVRVDYVVNLKDVSDLARYWLDTNCNTLGQPCYLYNISSGEDIELSDLALLAGNWLNFHPRYYNP